ncbi:MAG: S-layer homology domain-containing protein [Lachnospiraceae bacterium]|nr:S-layer homology domain-containing protein [Lachnospiraceae bacterium]
MKKKITAFFMAAVMLLGLVHAPQAVMAANEEALSSPVSEAALPQSDPVALVTPDDKSTSEGFELNLTEEEFHALQQNAAEKNLPAPPVLPSEYISEAGISRAKWLQNLELLFDLTVNPEEYSDNYYTDLSEEYEYYDAVMIAVYFGLLEEDPGEEIRPDDAATRDFAAHTLNCLLGREKEAANYAFSDVSACEWPDDAQVAVELGWLSLVSNKFSPQQTLTVSEINSAISLVEAYLAEQTAGSGSGSYSFADWVIQIPATAQVSASYDDAMEVLTVYIANYSGTINAGDTFVFF